MPNIEDMHKPIAVRLAEGENLESSAVDICVEDLKTHGAFCLLFVRIEWNANDNDSYSMVKACGTERTFPCKGMQSYLKLGLRASAGTVVAGGPEDF
jgi:hypothetical protein